MIFSFNTCTFAFFSHKTNHNAAAAPVIVDERKPRTFRHQAQLETTTVSLQAVTVHQRKSANYNQNLWQYDFIQSLGERNLDKDVTRKRVEWLKQDVVGMFSEAMDSTTMLELIDRIIKLGLSDVFEKQIKEALDELLPASHSHANNNNRLQRKDSSIYHTTLCFRLLRQFGRAVSLDYPLEHLTSDSLGAEALMELLEASNLAREGEDVLDVVRAFTVDALEERVQHLGSDLSRRAIHSLELPLQRRVRWFDVRWQIDAYERSANTNPGLLELAKHNFNAHQAFHQDDLKDVSRWWRDLGLMQHLEFARDRLVESFIYALGVAPEPKAKSLRQSLTKVVAMILVIDDIYDIFGSFEELKCFTRAIKIWDSEEIKQLPKCMKISFRALDDITNKIAREIGKEADLDQVVSRLRKAWADFCEGMFVEVKWDKTRYVPTLEQYLDNAWITSSGPLILSHAYHFLSGDNVEDIPMLLDTNKDIIRNSSVIIRLCNDLRTSAAERERGDARSSVACYMREANVSEEIAREHIEGLITRSWKCINAELYGNRSEYLRPFMEVTANTARTAHMIYQHGDGFGVQGGEMRDLITASLVQPFMIQDSN